MSVETRNCQNCKTDFNIEPEDFDFYKKIDVPPPTFCPECRLVRRLIFRNERTYHKRQCDLCKENIIATYPADASHPVYCVKCWWSDKWDPSDYGRDFDFNRSFFEQFKELLNTVPAISMMNDNGISSVNCEYSYDWFYSKNCYMTVCGWHAENCLYAFYIGNMKDSLDCSHVINGEMLYECSFCLTGKNLNRCRYCENCRDSQDCILSYGLQGCSDCVMCVGLKNKKYCIRNKQYSKEEYFRDLEAMKLDERDSLEKYLKEFEAFALQFPRRYASVIKSVDTTGDFLVNCKNSKNCFFGNGLENCKFIVVSDEGGKESYDLIMTGAPELCYESVTADHSYGSIASVFSVKSKNVQYSQYSPSADSCFGCVGMKNGLYSIFNKKYSKEEYESLRSRIVEHMRKTGEWGEFFPQWMTPYAYNETAAQEWFPLSREEATAKGYQWRQSEDRHYEITKNFDELPESIGSVGDEIVKDIISCGHGGTCNEKCSSAFRILPTELQLYRRLNIPLPQLCPNCRHYSRLKKRKPPHLWRRRCMCDDKVFQNAGQHVHHENSRCSNEFETSYSPDGPEIVYCEQCYQQEVV